MTILITHPLKNKRDILLLIMREIAVKRKIILKLSLLKLTVSEFLVFAYEFLPTVSEFLIFVVLFWLEVPKHIIWLCWKQPIGLRFQLGD